jgi:hypothetical protein
MVQESENAIYYVETRLIASLRFLGTINLFAYANNPTPYSSFPTPLLHGLTGDFSQFPDSSRR